MGSLNTSRQKIKLLDIETLAANGVPAAGNPHATLKTPNNKFFVGSNNGPYVHVLNNIYGSLLDMTSVNTGLGGANADLSYNTVDNMIYGISTFVYSMDPNTLAVTPFYSIPGGSYNAALTNDGLNLYVGDNGYIRKYRISDQTFLTNYNFANGYVHSMKVTPDNQYVLATTISITGGGGKLIKIKISDGTVSTLDFSSTIGGTPTDDFVIIGDYIYVGDEYSYKGGKINWKNMTIDKVINLPMNCWFVSTDGQYAYFGARSNLIFCFDPATERTATLNVPFNFSGGESLNELVYIENNIWLGTNYATNNAKIVRLYINPFSEADRTSAKISIKKQNQSILNPVESTEQNIYVFKSATTNLLGTIFNPAIFEDFDLIVMFAPGATNVYTDPSIKTIIKITPTEWVDAASEESMNNYVIPIGTVFYFSCPSFPNLNIPVGGEAIIQKFYSGKLNLNLYTATDPDARNYISAVEAADEQPLEPQVKIAINNFILGCKSDNIWTAIKASCLLAGAKTLNGALVSLVGTAPTNFNFIPADYDRKTGLLGDGSTKYLSSNRDNNADPQDNKHLSVYCTSGQTRNSTKYMIGSIVGVGGSFIATTATTCTARINYASPPATISTTALLTNLIGVTRYSSTNTNVILEGSITPISNTSATPSTSNITIFTRADLQFYSNARIAFYSIGENIDLQKLDNRVRAYVNAISSI